VAKAAEIAQFASFFNQGQNCTAGSKIFVHESIYDEFLVKAKELTAARKTGDPFEEATMHGPQIDKKQLDKVLELIQSGVEEGATLEVGGKADFKDGFYVLPTLFSNVNQDMKIAQEEVKYKIHSVQHLSYVFSLDLWSCSNGLQVQQSRRGY